MPSASMRYNSSFGANITTFVAQCCLVHLWRVSGVPAHCQMLQASSASREELNDLQIARTEASGENQLL